TARFSASRSVERLAICRLPTLPQVLDYLGRHTGIEPVTPGATIQWPDHCFQSLTACFLSKLIALNPNKSAGYVPSFENLSVIICWLQGARRYRHRPAKHRRRQPPTALSRRVEFRPHAPARRLPPV